MRPYPTPLPPPPIILCSQPIPTSAKAPQQIFNKREYWGWGANLAGRNCVPLS